MQKGPEENADLLCKKERGGKTKSEIRVERVLYICTVHGPTITGANHETIFISTPQTPPPPSPLPFIQVLSAEKNASRDFACKFSRTREFFEFQL